MSAKTVGQQLRQRRESRSLTLAQVSQATRMRLHYLQALEDGELRALPSVPQARGFLRTYANFLGLDAQALLLSLNANGDVEQSEVAPPAVPKTQSEEQPEAPPEAESETLQDLAPAAPPTKVIERVIEVPPRRPVEADLIFSDVGKSLQRQRELLGLSLEDVERHTHLRKRYLVALEAGNMDELPSPVQCRGMLKNYATFLGLDPEPVLLRFAEGLQTRRAVKQAEQPVVAPKAPPRKPVLPAPLRRLLSGDVLIGGTLAVFLVAFVVWGAIRIFAMGSASAPSATAPSIADVLLATQSETPTPSLEPKTPTGALPILPVGVSEALTTTVPLSVTVPTGGKGVVQVYVTVHQRAWMRSTVDGKVEFEGRVLPGSAYTFSGNEAVDILTGNGSALQIFFNQQDLGLMGVFGQVVERVYTPQGAVSPTPTVTLTPTVTPRTTPTPPARATAAPGTATAPPLP